MVLRMSIAQIGILIPKHHRYITRSVSAPPINGLTIAEIPRNINITPVSEALFSSGQEVTRMRTDLDISPAAPHSAIARPMFRAAELGATVRIREPMAKRTSASM